MKTRKGSTATKKTNLIASKIEKINNTTKKNMKTRKRSKIESSVRKDKTKEKIFEVIFTESESDDSTSSGQEWSKKTKQLLNSIVAETGDDNESVDNYEDESCSSQLGNNTSRPRLFRKSRKIVDSVDGSENFEALELEDACENNGTENGSKLTKKGMLTRSSRSTNKKDHATDKAPVYYLRTASIPLKDIGDLLPSYSKEKLANSWTLNRIRQSSSSTDSSPVSLKSDRDDADFSLSESSTSEESSIGDSKEFSTSEESSIGDSKEFSTSEESSIGDSEDESSSGSRRYVSSTDGDSDTSDELEELEDDFILHTSKTRKSMYTMRKRNNAVRKKVAKYCTELSDEESNDSSEE